MADEYIKREDAIKAMWKALYDYEDKTEKQFADDQNLDVSEWFTHRIFVQVIHAKCLDVVEAIPSADVQPVAHGRWIKARGSWFTPGGDPVWECSECGKGRHVYGVEHGTYGSDVADGQWVACPNCGAKMNGGT